MNDATREVGAPPHERWHLRTLGPVFYPSAAITLVLVMLSFVAPDLAERVFGSAKTWVADDAGWFTVLASPSF